MFPTLDEIRANLPDTRETQRFLAKLDVGPVPEHRPEMGPCLPWTGARDSGGYGMFRTEAGVLVPVHVWLFGKLGGVVPPGHELDHLCHHAKACRVPVRDCPHRPCALHVQPKTHRDNVLAGNAPTAINAAKTHCVGKYSPRAADGTIIGHPWYNPDGTYTEHVYIAPDGTLKCKTCQREREKVWYEKAQTLRIRARERGLAKTGQLQLLDL